jgi:hypothetical protein
MAMHRSTLVDGLVEAGLPHSLALVFIDANFAAHAAGILFLSEVRFTAGACAVVVASPFGAVVGLRSRRCGNRSIESRARRLDQTPGVNAPLGDQTATRRWWTARRHREHRESGRSGG